MASSRAMMANGADVEPAHPVLVGPGGRWRTGVAGLALLACGGGHGVGGLDRGLDQHLEPGPGDTAVGGLRDPGVDVRGLLGGEVAGLAGHVPGVGRF